MERKSLYEKLPDELLGAFYCYIQNNIDKGIHIELMNKEIKLIEDEANKRGITVSCLKEMGTSFVSREMEILHKNM
ncbi:hypothetical protein [Oceanobacillus senegalensis]|uniref:hypothetical protein n=1 Tax=Oceanobacillus senegalensis TaxID=1936063 RepID=UPI000A313354|nr:hypothetical protein [Oceanobacillus senegalensis]